MATELVRALKKLQQLRAQEAQISSDLNTVVASAEGDIMGEDDDENIIATLKLQQVCLHYHTLFSK